MRPSTGLALVACGWEFRIAETQDNVGANPIPGEKSS
jgi:hypothetical protein